MKGIANIGTNKYYVLRVDLSEKEEMVTTAMVFRKRKDQLDLDRELAAAPLKVMLKQIARHSGIVLLLAGNQVLSRFSSGEPKNLFEEIDEEEFYSQKLVFDNGWTIQSACRKSTVDPVLDLIVLKNLFLLHIAFDPAVIPEIANLAGDGMVSSGHLRFQFRDGMLEWITEAHSDDPEVTHESGLILEGISLSSTGIVMLAGLMHYLNGGSSVMAPVIQKHQAQNSFYRRFKWVAAATMLGLFILLLVNFLVFSSLQQHLNLLKASGESRAEIITEIDRLQSQIEEYSHLSLNHLDVVGKSYSFYLEELARLRPSGVWFEQLEIDPLLKKPESGKSVEADRSQIRLVGEARDPVSLNKFISALKDLSWVSDIELKNYESSRESTTALFEIIIRKANEL